jgi:hypothetical protein
LKIKSELTGYSGAERAIPGGGASPAESEELARRLAYWAAVYKQLPSLPDGDGS